MLPRAGTRVVRPLPLGVRVAAPALLIVLLLVAEATLVAYSPSAFDVPQRRRPLETRDEALQVQAFNDALEAGRVLASGTGAKRIVIAMSTVPRVLSAQPHHQQQQVQYADYLMSSLEALVPQLPQYGNVRAASLVSVAAVSTLLIEPTHPIQLKVDVQVVVMNHVAGNHSVFEQARDRYVSHAQVHWIENRARRLDPHAELPEPEDANNHANLPGKKVRQQTLDCRSCTRASSDSKRRATMRQPPSRSSSICCCSRTTSRCARPHCRPSITPSTRCASYNDDYGDDTDDGIVLTTMQRMQQAHVYHHNDWKLLRVSFGGGGVVLPWSRVSSLAAYLEQYAHRLPPDLLMVDWLCEREPACTTCGRCTAATNGAVTFRFNLATHIGVQSSLRSTSRPVQPKCWQLYGTAVSDAELFDEQQCGNDDISPCREAQDRFAARFGETGLLRHLPSTPDSAYFNNFIVSLRLENTRFVYFVPRFDDILFEAPIPSTAATMPAGNNLAMALILFAFGLLAW